MKLTEKHKLMLFSLLADTLSIIDDDDDDDDDDEHYTNYDFCLQFKLAQRKKLYMDILFYQDEIIEDKLNDIN